MHQPLTKKLHMGLLSTIVWRKWRQEVRPLGQDELLDHRFLLTLAPRTKLTLLMQDRALVYPSGAAEFQWAHLYKSEAQRRHNHLVTFATKSMAHFSAGLTYFEYWLPAWLSVNEYNTLTLRCIVCFHVPLFKWPHLCREKKQQKNTSSLKLYYIVLKSSQIDAPVAFFMIFFKFLQGIHHNSTAAYRSIGTDPLKEIPIETLQSLLLAEITSVWAHWKLRGLVVVFTGCPLKCHIFISVRLILDHANNK